MQSRAFEGGGAGQDLSTEIKNVRGPVLLRDGETGLTHVCSGGETFYLSLGEGGCVGGGGVNAGGQKAELVPARLVSADSHRLGVGE